MVHDGAPSDNLYGSDLFPGYEDAGYALFRDNDRFKGHYLTADLLDESPQNPLVQSAGTWDVISAFMFLHVFDLENMTRACKRIAHLLSSEQHGSYLIGTLTGSFNPKEFPLGPPFAEKKGERTVYRHSVESFVDMWKKVEQEEQIKLDIWVEYEGGPRMESTYAGGKTVFGGDDNKRIHFVVKKI